MKNYKKGFAPIILIIIAVVAIGGGAYVFTKNKSVNNRETNSNNQTVNANLNSKEDQEKIKKIISDFEELKRIEPVPERVKSWSYVPEPRKIATTADLGKYTTTSVLGIEFKTPWGKGTESENSKKSTVLKQINFKNGKSILISVNKGKVRDELLENFKKEEVDQITAAFGDKMNSNYEFRKYVLSSTPEQININMPIKQAESIEKALALKTVTLSSYAKTYSFETSTIKGFQFGDYTQPNTSVTVEFFTANGDWYSLMSNKKHNLSQSDVDLILSTIKVK